MSDVADRITKLETQNGELRQLVEDLKKELTLTETRLDEIEKAQAAAPQQQGKKKEKKKKGGGGDGKPQEKKKTKKEEAAEKEYKAALKEGGKKGQDLAGMHDLGGMIFFTVCLEQCKGDWNLMQAAIDGANKVPDPDGDDRKGGAGELYKCFLSCDETEDCKFIFHGPSAEFKKDDVTLGLRQWADQMLSASSVIGEVIEWAEDGCSGRAIAKKNEEKQLFPLKQRDAAIGVSFDMLRERHLIPEEDSGSEQDMSAMYEDAGVEW